MLKDTPFVSVVMPCLNEEKTVGVCVQKAKTALRKGKIKGEVVVSDNGSTDRSVNLALKAGARIIKESRKGYGSAYLAGIRAARGVWIVMADSDGTYDFTAVPRLVKPLASGFDLVIGSRLKGQIKKDAMPFLNRYLGTPILNFFLRLFYHLRVSDSQSGMRAFTREAFEKLKLKTIGMEFASEMLVRAVQEELKITEVPVNYFPRLAPSKLSRFRDAWRHLRFMLLFAPTWLFLLPGGLLLGIGLLAEFLIFVGPFWIFGHGLDIHSMVFASLMVLLGYQIIMLGIYAKVFSYVIGLEKGSQVITTTLKYFKLEKGIFLGLLISLAGLIVGLTYFIDWAEQGFGSLLAIRPAILSMTLFILGIQIIFSSFFLSILGVQRK